MAGIERKSLNEPDDSVDYGELGMAAKVTVGMAGFGLGSESTVWLSTLRRAGAGSATSSRTCHSRTARSITAST